MARKKKCITCKRESECRGLCLRCYQAARARVAREEATEEDLIEMGFLLPSRQSTCSPFDAAVEKAISK